MDDESPSSDDDRAVELSTISAIYPELTLSPSILFSASLELPVVPASPLRVLFDQPVAESAVQSILPTPPNSTEAGEQDDGKGMVGPQSRPANTEPDMHLLSHL